jgi:murein DD-endopeptidase MepM/ murein hydrolase activator NlpD
VCVPGSRIHAIDGFCGSGAGDRVLRAAARFALLPCVIAALGALPAMLAPASADASLLSAADGNLASFSGGLSQVNGTLTAIGGRYGRDTKTFGAMYSGSGPIGLASGSFKVRWKQGQTVAYGAAFYLPPGFHAATAGQQALLTWDNSPGNGGRYAQDGVVIDYSDNLAYLVAGTVSGSTITQQVLAGPFILPIGGWFTLQVRQLLAAGSSAYSEVYVNRQLVASSRAPNFSGKRIGHVRYGIVQLSAGAQQGPVSLEFDRAIAAGYTGYVNPLGGDRYSTGRTDMGVDFCLTRGEPIRALGDGIVVGISPDWFEHQPYIWYQLVDGPYAGRYVYAAEQIRRLAHVGAQLTAGQPLAYYKRSGTCIEMGWSAADGATTAQATTGYREGQVTLAGVSFAQFLTSLGVGGPFELTPTHRRKRTSSR